MNISSSVSIIEIVYYILSQPVQRSHLAMNIIAQQAEDTNYYLYLTRAACVVVVRSIAFPPSRRMMRNSGTHSPHGGDHIGQWALLTED